MPSATMCRPRRCPRPRRPAPAPAPRSPLSPLPAPAASCWAALPPPTPRASRPACPPCFPADPAPRRHFRQRHGLWAWGRGLQGQRMRAARRAQPDWWGGGAASMRRRAAAGAGPGDLGGAGVRAPWGRGRAAPAGARPSQDGGGHARPRCRVCAAGGGGAARAADAAAALACPSVSLRGRYLRLSPPCPAWIYPWAPALRGPATSRPS